MSGERPSSVIDILGALADLSPAAARKESAAVIPLDWFRWLPMSALRVVMPPDRLHDVELPSVSIDRGLGERLAAIDQVRSTYRSLRIGWLFVVGRAAVNGKRFRVFHPLVSVPVRVVRGALLSDARLVPAGDVELTPRIDDLALRERLENEITVGGGALGGLVDTIPDAVLRRLHGLQAFARDATAAAGLPAEHVISSTENPDDLIRRDELVVVAGAGVFTVDDVASTGRADILRAWKASMLQSPTAFHSIYVGVDADPVVGPVPSDRVVSAYPLTAAQRSAIVVAREAPVTVIAGAPGTGKSHTIAAIAHDALSRSESVLIAAKTEATVDALVDLLERSPGPNAVVFGSTDRRQELAQRLAGGMMRPTTRDALGRARAALDAAVRAQVELASRVTAALRAHSLEAWEVDDARVRYRFLFRGDVDLSRIREQVDAIQVQSRGLRAWWRRRTARRQLGELVGGAVDTATCIDLARSLDIAESTRASSEPGADPRSPDTWVRVLSADDAVRRRFGEWLAADALAERRINRHSLAAIGALATALRSGRATRRTQLRRIDDDRLTTALPLWIGTLADVDDLLPQVGGIFDIVILDEASSIDQPLATAALLRGKRVVVVGDPRQLRHVSFVSDRQIADVLVEHGIVDPLLGSRLDVRRNSAFDVAATAASVIQLDEHFRCDPHLMDYVAKRIYDGAVKVATRTPATHGHDCVELTRVDGHRDGDGVVTAEVGAVISELRAALELHRRSVGVLTPFRAQADALETAVLDAFTADDLEALDLRVGTVHAFQGNERDTIVASLGIGSDSEPATWRFVDDPHLLSVFLTRARKRLHVFHSADPPERSLLAGYLEQTDSPPGSPPSGGTTSAWTTSLANDLRVAGFGLEVGYPTGRHVVDIAIAGTPRPIAITCTVHRDGPDSHIERHLALVRAGWNVFEAFEPRGTESAADVVLAVTEQLRDRSPAAPAN